MGSSYPVHPNDVLGWPCPAVGAEWEQRSAAVCGQMPSDTVMVAAPCSGDIIMFFDEYTPFGTDVVIEYMHLRNLGP